ncbi:MAG TPA: fluoride efflux transporter CrcB [Tepidisphaeraceae bacterium]|nr:fluoride efflux transporter CrcB [Tepidisphaeraceae bacterium]
MQQFLLVGLGGAVGAVARWQLGELVLRHTPGWRFPLGTVAVNVVGCLAAGVLAGLAARSGVFSADAKLFLFTGLLGGFTTFSAFGLETVALLRRGDHTAAAAYVMLSVGCGAAALWLAVVCVGGKLGR